MTHKEASPHVGDECRAIRHASGVPAVGVILYTGLAARTCSDVETAESYQTLGGGKSA